MKHLIRTALSHLLVFGWLIGFFLYFYLRGDEDLLVLYEYLAEIGLVPNDRTLIMNLLSFLIFFGLPAWLIYKFTFSFWENFVESKIFPEQSEYNRFGRWSHFPPAPLSSFAIQNVPTAEKREIDSGDLSGTYCILGETYHCSIPSTPNIHFEYDNDEDEEHSIGINLFEKSDTGVLKDSEVSISVTTQPEPLDPIIEAVLAKEQVADEDIENLKPKIIDWFKKQLPLEQSKFDLEDAQIEVDIQTIAVQKIQQRNVFSLKVSIHMELNEESIKDFSKLSEENQNFVGKNLALDVEGFSINLHSDKDFVPSFSVSLLKTDRGDDFLSLAENLIRGTSVQDFGFLGQIPLFQGEFLSRPKSS